VLGVRVTGGESFTDWRRRPLSDAQIEYAADDVRYLLEIREKVGAKARKMGREEWIEDECRRAVERLLAGEREERWWRVSGGTGLNRRELAALRELWRWRDSEARARNHPPRKVMRDELLVEIAKRQPKSTADLLALRGLERGSIRSAAGEIVAAVDRALKLPQSELPVSMRRDDPAKVGVLTQLLTVMTNSLAAEHQVDVALLATNADLQELVRWRLGLTPEEEEPIVLTGWRGSILREPLLGMLDGRYAVRVAKPEAANPLAIEAWGPVRSEE
jgi:ribonuclease D